MAQVCAGDGPYRVRSGDLNQLSKDSCPRTTSRPGGSWGTSLWSTWVKHQVQHLMVVQCQKRLQRCQTTIISFFWRGKRRKGRASRIFLFPDEKTFSLTSTFAGAQQVQYVAIFPNTLDLFTRFATGTQNSRKR